MPYVNIRITKEETTKEQKQALVSGVTKLLEEVLGKNPKTTFVIIDEVPCDNWAIEGELVSDKRACD
jgi:4-oxalocrotonate tautomerase